MNKGKCIILAASDFNQEFLDKNENDYLIVADSGYINFKKIKNLSINDIDLLIGDFDSLDVIPNEIKVEKLNPIKDDTDVLSAMKYGLKLGYKNFELYGCIGGRFEHSFANISALAFLKANRANGIIKLDNQIIELLENEVKLFDDTFKGYISCFSYSDKCQVTLNNFKYELEKCEINNSFPLGIDNEFIGKEAKIEVFAGKLLIIYYL